MAYIADGRYTGRYKKRQAKKALRQAVSYARSPGEADHFRKALRAAGLFYVKKAQGPQ